MHGCLVYGNEHSQRVLAPLTLSAVVRLWQSIPPPVGLLAGGDEGASEIDVVIEASTWIWFIEAKYRSDISFGTTTRPEHDQVLRNLDVGSYHAGVRQFFFSLLISAERTSPEGVNRISKYSDLSVPRAKLHAHRPDGLQNLKAIGLLTWQHWQTCLRKRQKRRPGKTNARTLRGYRLVATVAGLI